MQQPETKHVRVGPKKFLDGAVSQRLHALRAASFFHQLAVHERSRFSSWRCSSHSVEQYHQTVAERHACIGTCIGTWPTYLSHSSGLRLERTNRATTEALGTPGNSFSFCYGCASGT